MKKIFILCSILMASMSVLAEGEQKVDATKVSKITFDGDNVIVHYNDGTSDTSFDMAAIVISFENAAGIEERMAIVEKEGLAGKPVYNIQGQLVGNDASNLSKGLYIINGKKVIIK